MKHFLSFKQLLASLLFLFVTATVVAQPSSWTYTITGMNHTVLIVPGIVTIDGVEIAQGDYIGAFYTIGSGPDLGNAGYAQYTGQNIGVTVWGSEPGLNNGLSTGEEFKWKVWRAADGAIIDMTASYQSGFSNGGTYATNGISSLSSLTGTGPVVSFNVTGEELDATCYNDCNGEITLTVVGGTAPYSFEWSNGETTQNLSSLCAGNYSVTVTDAGSGGSSTIDPFDWTYFITGSNHTVLVQPGVVTIDGDPAQVGDIIGVFYTVGAGPDLACGGYINWQGSNTAVTAWGSEPGLNNGLATGESFKWKLYRASTGETIDMVASYQLVGFPNQGNYTTNGISALATLSGNATQTGGGTGNTMNLSFEITQPDEIIVSAVLSNYDGFNISVFGGNDGSIDLTVSGGVAPYTFAWSDGNMLEDRTNLSAGIYSVTITDSNNCNYDTEFELMQPLIIPIEIVSSKIDASCFESCDGQIDILISGGIQPYEILWTNGVTGFNPSQLCAGNYSATISDAGTGAQAQSQILSFEILEPTQILISSSINMVACNYGSDGSIDLTVTGGIEPYSFAWSNLAQTEDLIELSAAEYTLTITDANDCQVIESFTVTQPEPLVLSAQISEILCFGLETSSIILSVSGGVADYNYEWNNGSILSDLVNIPAGEYSVTVTDANDCSAFETFSVSEPSELIVETVSYNISCYGAQDGVVEIDVNGGTSPYTIAWIDFPNETGFEIENLAPGTYEFVVNDINGCYFESEVSITEPAELALSGILSDYFGYNISLSGATDGSIAISVSGGTTPYSYAWSNGSTTASLNNIPAGSYSLTVTDANGCSANFSAVLTEPDPTELLSISGAITHVTCFGLENGGISLTISGGTPPYSILWNSGQITNVLSNLIAGIYSVTVTDIDNNEIVGNYSVNEPGNLMLDLSPSDYNGYGIACYLGNNGTVEALVSGGTQPYSYNWSTGSTTSLISNLTIGTYSVTILDDNGCVTSGEVTLNQPFSMAASSSSINASCFNTPTGAINFSVVGGTAPYTYSWSNGATTQNVNNLMAGIYSVTATDANGCTFSVSRTITQPDALALSLNISNEVSCFDFSNGVLSASISGGTSPYSYTWSVETPNPGATLSGLSSGIYSLTVTDSKGCEIVDTQTLDNPLEIEVSSTIVDILCFGDATGEIEILGTGGTGMYNYQWSNGATTQNLIGIQSGEYTLSLTDGNSCLFTETYFVAQNMQIESNAIITDLLCSGAASGTIELEILGGVEPYSVLWNNSSTSFSLSGLIGGEYSLTITDAYDCSFTNTYFVFEPEAIEITGQSINVTCNGFDNGSINVFVAGGTPSYTYEWSNGSSNQNLQSLAGGTYTLTVTDGNACIQIASFEVVNPELITASFDVFDLLCNGDDNGSIGVTPIGGTAPYYFAWSTGVFIQDLNNLTSGVYTITITDINGCQGVESVTLNEPAQIEITHVTSDYDGFGVSCFGYADGYAELSVSGGVLPYTFLWSNGETSQSVYDIPAGDISVGIIDGNGCSITEGPQLPWTYENTGENHTIFVPSAQINGNDIQIGDYLGVFYDNGSELVCAGYIQWSGVQNAISAWGSESGQTNGFVQGESFNWKVWRASDGLELEMNPVYDITSFPNGDAYITNGISGLITLTGSGPALQPNLGYFINLTSPEPLVATGETSDYNSFGVSCNGAQDGSISLLIETCLEEYEILWNTGATTQSISNLAAGNYSAVISYVYGEATVPTPFNWTYTNTGENHSIYIPSAQINGYALAIGDYVGVFYEQNGSLACAGYIQWQGLPVGLSVWGTEPQMNNGLAQGEEFKWKVWRALDGAVIDMTATYSSVFPNSNTYVTNGISGTSSLTGQSNLSSFVGDYSIQFTLTEPVTLTLSGQASGNACFGDAFGNVTVIVEGGTPPYTYEWSSGETGQEIFDVTFGEYTITVTDLNGCEIVETFNVSQPDELLVTAQVINVSCFDGTNGSVSSFVSGGTQPYTYLWSNGEESENIFGLTEGVYELTVIDANDCQVSASYIVTQPTALTIVGDVVNVDCNGNSSGEIHLFVDGGTAPYSYVWSNSNTSANIVNLTSGSYSVVVTDANGCTIESSFEVTQPDVLQLAYEVTPILCYGGSNGAIDLFISGGTAPYTYTWANGATTANLSNLSAAAYAVTVTDANGCLVNTLIFVNQPLQLQANGIVANNTCNGSNNGSIDLTVSGGTAPYMYSWTGGFTTQDISGLAIGTYSVLVMDDNGCTISRTFQISEPALLVSTAQITNVSCYGGMNGVINQTVTGGTAPYFYTWSSGQYTKNISGLAAGNYSVTISDARGCITTNTYVITEPPVLEVDYFVSDYGQYNVSAFGALDGFIILSPSGGTFPYTYQWSNGASSYYQIFIGAGFYQVTVTDVKGCSVVLNIQLTSAPNYTPMILDLVASNYNGYNISCNGLYDGSLSVLVTGGVAPFTYEWNNGSTVNQIMALGAATYAVTVTDATGISVSSALDLIEPDPIMVSATINAPTCFGGADGSIQLIANSVYVPYSYVWSNSSLLAVANQLEAGLYSVEVTDAMNCSSTFNFEVINPEAIQIDFTISEPICGGDGSISVTLLNASSPVQYYWSNNQTAEALENLSGGLYELTIVDANGCSANGSVELSSGAAIYATAIQSDISCNGLQDGSLSLVVLSGMAPYTFEWSTGQSTQTVNSLGEGLHIVTITDDNNCQGVFEFVIVEPDQLEINAVIDNVLCYEGNDGEIQVSVSGGVGPYSFLWNDGSTLAHRSQLMAGNYSLTISDANYCTIIESFEVIEPEQIQIEGEITHLTCFKSNDGSIDITVSGGVGPYSYNWTNFSTSEDLNQLKAGQYRVIVTDVNGCMVYSELFVLTQPSPITASITEQTPISCDGIGGALLVTVNGGTPNYFITWDNQSNSELLTNLTAGTYSVTVVDENGCVTESSYQLVAPISMQLTLFSIDASCYGEEDGQAFVSVTGGQAPYTYLWSDLDASITPDLLNVSAGNYSVTVTDANGCEVIDNVLIDQPDQLLISLQVYAFSTSAIVAATVTGGDGPYTYSWIVNDNQTPVLTSFIKNVPIGAELTLVVTDANGCSEFTTITVSNPSLITPQDIELIEEFMLDINEIVAQNISIYPNPAKDGRFFIQTEGFSSELVQIEVYDSYGKLVRNVGYSMHTGSIIEVKLSNYANGLYFIKFTNATEHIATKRVMLTE